MKREDRNVKMEFYILSFCLGKIGGFDMAAKLERDFQAKLILELKDRFPGCMVMKLDSSYIQGIPDLLILYHDKWASLECKKSASAKNSRIKNIMSGR